MLTSQWPGPIAKFGRVANAGEADREMSHRQKSFQRERNVGYDFIVSDLKKK
jgi:hypothetical protein